MIDAKIATMVPSAADLTQFAPPLEKIIEPVKFDKSVFEKGAVPIRDMLKRGNFGDAFKALPDFFRNLGKPPPSEPPQESNAPQVMEASSRPDVVTIPDDLRKLLRTGRSTDAIAAMDQASSLPADVRVAVIAEVGGSLYTDSSDPYIKAVLEIEQVVDAASAADIEPSSNFSSQLEHAMSSFSIGFGYMSEQTQMAFLDQMGAVSQAVGNRSHELARSTAGFYREVLANAPESFSRQLFDKVTRSMGVDAYTYRAMDSEYRNVFAKISNREVAGWLMDHIGQSQNIGVVLDSIDGYFSNTLVAPDDAFYADHVFQPITESLKRMKGTRILDPKDRDLLRSITSHVADIGINRLNSPDEYNLIQGLTYAEYFLREDAEALHMCLDVDVAILDHARTPDHIANIMPLLGDLTTNIEKLNALSQRTPDIIRQIRYDAAIKYGTVMAHFGTTDSMIRAYESLSQRPELATDGGTGIVTLFGELGSAWNRYPSGPGISPQQEVRLSATIQQFAKNFPSLTDANRPLVKIFLNSLARPFNGDGVPAAYLNGLADGM